MTSPSLAEACERLRRAGRRAAESSAEDLERFRSLRATGCPPGTFLGEGARVVRRMLERDRALSLLSTPEWALELPVPPDLEVLVSFARDLRRAVGYRFHQCVMALGAIPDPGRLEGSLLVALDGIDGSEDVGALVRSAAAFGADGVIVGPGTASPWHRRAVRSAMGTTLDLPVHFVEDLPDALGRFRTFAVAEEGRAHREVDLASDCCLVFGGEDDRVRPEVLASCRGGSIAVPLDRGVECLNAASAAAVLLAEARRQRGLARRD